MGGVVVTVPPRGEASGVGVAAEAPGGRPSGNDRRTRWPVFAEGLVETDRRLARDRDPAAPVGLVRHQRLQPATRLEAASRTTARLDERTKDAKDGAEKEKLRAEKDQLEAELDEAERVFYGHMFWVAYPVGLVAVIVGTFFPVQAVARAHVRGLGSLTTGCYSYWDRMGDRLRFGSLVTRSPSCSSWALGDSAL